VGEAAVLSGAAAFLLSGRRSPWSGIQLVYRHFPLVFRVATAVRGCQFPRMGRTFAFAALALIASQAQAFMLAPLYDPVALNVGISCQWQRSCERRQLDAMARARFFVASARPPVWRIHLCNKNARRGTARVDWIGFDNCIRNPRFRPPRSRGR